MIKVSVMYAHKPGVRFDYVFYRDRHQPLIKERMGEGSGVALIAGFYS